MAYKKIIRVAAEEEAAAAAAAAAAAEAKKAAPYERLWNPNPAGSVPRDTTAETTAAQAAGTAKTNRSYTPPPMLQNMDSGTAWWKPPEPKGLISNNMRGY